jgi:hypothetical protein
VLSIFIAIGELLVLIVGIVASIMWITAAFAVLYHSVERREGIPEGGEDSAQEQAVGG